MELELDEIFRLQVMGASDKQIMEIRRLSERNYRKYTAKLKEHHINQQLQKEPEELLHQKEILRERFENIREYYAQRKKSTKNKSRSRQGVRCQISNCYGGI